MVVAFVFFLIAIVCFTLAFKGFKKKKTTQAENKKQIYTPVIDKEKKRKKEQANELLKMIVHVPVDASEINPEIRLMDNSREHNRIGTIDHTRYIRARKLVDSFTAIDFETTGLNYWDSEIIEIGAVKYTNNQEIDRFQSYVKPIKSLITSTITRITGITDEMVKSAPIINEVLPDFLNFVGDSTIVAHNASFDMKFLLSAADFNNIEIRKFRVIDTLSLSRKTFLDTKNHKLDTLKKELKLGNLKSHDALNDAEITGKLYLVCKSKQKNAVK